MTDNKEYMPSKVWQWDAENGGKFAKINRPVAGSTHDKVLTRGKHPFQLYSLATPNGVKVTVMLEELLALGHSGAEYDAYLIDISEGDQFSSGFVDINPNSKIPALLDYSEGHSKNNSGNKGSDHRPIRIFESGAILLHLAEKFNAFIPSEPSKRIECLSWLFWQMGSAPYLGGGFGHFYAYAPTKIEYCINRFAMEVKRQLDVLDRQLAKTEYIAGDDYTIADIAIYPWYGAVVQNTVYEAAEFLDTASYKHLTRWAEQISQRDAVKRGRMVNCSWGPLEQQLRERHDASDFDLKTQDKLEQD